ncbi:spore coat protein [Bacillus sp. AFS015802]|uniref:CotH kinase family protein n=1 Tax=Bacillus sp. AFS015802 TaxID=2033486 RepID=UPI000BF5A134|nr:CotH kinase family protein [Bacillus sp. AFS015802]PFA66498.1 spore coat protein [Bacillus sp. AFS015802]
MTPSLPSFDLQLDHDDIRKLERDVWSNSSVPAELKINDTLYDINIRYRGSYTRGLEKKSYQIEFVNSPEWDGSTEIHLNAESFDPSHFRNKLSLDFMGELGIHTPDSQHVFLTQDGIPLGLYLQLESVDEMYLKKRDLPPGTIYYAVNDQADFSVKRKRGLTSGYQRKLGNMQDDHHLIHFIRSINAPATFQHEIHRLLDIENYLRWLAGAVCTMNNDGFTHNYALYLNRSDQRFSIIPWDYDATFGRRVNGDVMEWDYVPITGKAKNKLTTQLMKRSGFRRLYKDILGDILDTKFTVKYFEEKVMNFHSSLRPYVLMDPHFKDNIDVYDKEPSYIFQFIEDRSAFLRRELKYL